MTTKELKARIDELENDLIELEDKHAFRMSEMLELMTQVHKNMHALAQIVTRHQQLWDNVSLPDRQN